MKPQDYGGTESAFSKKVAKVRENQIKAHSRMMRSTGSAPPYTADENLIQRGDEVYIRRDALLKYATNHAETHECDGSPQWHNKAYTVTDVVNFGEFYQLDGFNKNKDGTMRQFRACQVQKANHVRVNDVVRVSMDVLKEYRQFMMDAVKSKQGQLNFNHTYTRALFRVTHFENGHYFLTLVWDPTTVVDDRAAFPNLKFEAEIKHTKEHYEEERQKSFFTADSDEGKFRGFRPRQLLVVDKWTQDHFKNGLTPEELKERQLSYTACLVRNQIKGSGSRAIVLARAKKLKREPRKTTPKDTPSCVARHALKMHLMDTNT